MNKQIAKLAIGGAELAVAVFDQCEHAKQGECVLYMSVDPAGGKASCDIRGYLSPAELLAVGHALIDAALLAEKVEALPGYLTKYENKAA